MKGGDQNIFERLSRYIPSEGEKQKREPREDFTTEAFAYLLNASGTLCRRFVEDCLRVQVGARAVFEVATQERTKGRRVDMTLRPVGDQETCFGIEIKISRSTGFTKDQLKAMGKNFDGKAYLLAPREMLEDYRTELNERGVQFLPWEQVFRVLSDVAEHEAGSNQTLMAQFCTYLESRGLADVIVSQHPMKVNSIADAARLMDEWTRVLIKLKAELGLRKGGKWEMPRWDCANDKQRNSFYGVYGEGDSYVGFEVMADGGVRCYVEEYAPGKIRTRHTSRSRFLTVSESNGRVCCVAREPLPDESEMSYEAIFRVFRGLQEKVRKTLATSTVKSSR